MLMMKLQYFGHLMQTDNSLEKSLMMGKIEGRRRWGYQRMRWMLSLNRRLNWGWHHQWNEHELGQTPGEGEGQGGLACCSPWGCKESDTTDQLNNTFIRGEMLAAMLSLAAACGLDRKWGEKKLVKRLLQSFIWDLIGTWLWDVTAETKTQGQIQETLQRKERCLWMTGHKMWRRGRSKWNPGQGSGRSTRQEELMTYMTHLSD